jgi:hypothetical protein
LFPQALLSADFLVLLRHHHSDVFAAARPSPVGLRIARVYTEEVPRTWGVVRPIETAVES